MPGFHPRREELPSEFPVFPLTGALLLPRGRLPLNIFEPRYLAMVEDALAAGRMFGMIQPDATAPPVANGPGLFTVGCLGRLTSVSETDDGRFLITLTGIIRFTVASELGMRRGYRRVAADWTRHLADLEPVIPEFPMEREGLLAELRSYFARSGFEANWDAIRSMTDDTLLITLCMVCPFEPAEKQALLEAATQADRLAALLALLRMGSMDQDHGAAGRAAS